MRRVILAVFVVALLVGEVGAQSRQPPEQPRAEKQRAASDERGTAEQPLVIDVVRREPNEAEAAEQRSERQRQSTREVWVIVLTGGLVIAAGLQAWFAFVATRGLKYARRSAEAAEANIETIQNTAKAQLRPYVYVVSAFLTEAKGTGDVKIIVAIKNGGATPAYDMTHQLGSRFRPAEFNEFMLPPDVPLSRGTLGPGVMVESELTVTRANWNEHAPGLIDGATTLSVLGEILYRDAFGETHFTRYRYALPPKIARDSTLMVCQEGNESS